MKRMKNKVKLNDIKMVFKVANTQHNFLKQQQYDVWEITLTRKGKQVISEYAARKGEFKEPHIDNVLNSLFNGASIYNRCNGNFFEFIPHFNFNSGTQAEGFFKAAKGSYKLLVELLGNDYQKYENYYMNLRPLPFNKPKFRENRRSDSDKTKA